MLYESRYYGTIGLGDSIAHHGVKGQKWGRRQWQYEDGSLTPAGRQHYGVGDGETLAGRNIKNLARTLRDSRKNGKSAGGSKDSSGKSKQEMLADGARLVGRGAKTVGRGAKTAGQAVYGVHKRHVEMKEQKRLAKEEAKNQGRQEKEQRKQETLEKKKRAAIQSGDTKKVIKNFDNLDTKEINEALERATLKQKLTNINTNQKKDRSSLLRDLVNTAKTTSDTIINIRRILKGY